MKFNGEPQYKSFVEKLVTTNYEVVGVRVPTLRQMAKELIKNGQWQEELNNTPHYHEDVLLQSFIIAAAPITVNERMQLLEQFFPLMDNWQVVDGLCSSLKEVKREQQAYWNWLLTFREVKEPYVVRFVIVMYLTYYLQESYLNNVLRYFEELEFDHYYVKMAVAWAISIVFIKHEQQVTQFLQNTTLDKWTYNKALQKIIESRQITEEMKQKVRGWKR